jgi:hypothetical protein
LYSVIHIEILLQLANRGRRDLGFDAGLQTDSADAFQRADAESVLPAAIARIFGFELAVHFLEAIFCRRLTKHSMLSRS